MKIKLYQINNIEDYFFYVINPSNDQINQIESNYPTGIEEINCINLSYNYNDMFIKNTLEKKLLDLVANNRFFKFESFNDFINIINQFQEESSDLGNFILNQINTTNSEKYISDVFSYNLKLKEEVILNMNKYFNKELSYFQFKKDNLNDCLAYEVLNNDDNYSLFVNFNKESYIQKT